MSKHRGLLHSSRPWAPRSSFIYSTTSQECYKISNQFQGWAANSYIIVADLLKDSAFCIAPTWKCHPCISHWNYSLPRDSQSPKWEGLCSLFIFQMRRSATGLGEFYIYTDYMSKQIMLGAIYSGTTFKCAWYIAIIKMVSKNNRNLWYIH